MIDSQMIALMRELVEVQAARAKNWPTSAGPENRALEAMHRKQIADIKKQLSVRRVAGPENTPAAEALQFSEGLKAPRRVTFLSRLVRRLTSSKQ